MKISDREVLRRLGGIEDVLRPPEPMLFETPEGWKDIEGWLEYSARTGAQTTPHTRGSNLDDLDRYLDNIRRIAEQMAIPGQ